MKHGRSEFRSRNILAFALLLLFTACGGGSYAGGGGGGGGNPPGTPTGLTATAGNQQVVLGWSASAGATSYHVNRSTASGGPYTQIASPTTVSYTDSGLTNGTTYYYVVAAGNSYGASANSAQVSAKPAAPLTSVNVSVDVMTDRHAISQFVYGTNFPSDPTYIQDSGTTLVRWGGNASTRYNWKNFDTNAAADWYFQNRPWDSSTNPPLPPDSVQYVSAVKAAGGFPLMTIGMLPWVAKDGLFSSYSFSVSKYGYTACKPNPFLADDGDGTKPGPTCSTPANVTGNDPHDAHVPLLDGPPQPGDPAGSVYRNQWVSALAPAFGSGIPHFYDMDNEVDIWSGTHRDVHPIGSGYDELRDTFLTESRALKTWDPLAIRFGPVSCCWYFYWNLPSPTDNKSAHAGIDFLPWWLNDVYWRDQIAGTRSLDAFDIHAYPDGPDISNYTLAQKQALAVRVFRDWWDPAYTSESWINGNTGVTQIQPVPYNPFRIPRMRAILNMTYPGTPLSITEWNAAEAGESDFSSALSDVDAWGILGRERVTYATRWTAATQTNPNYNALKLFRNYDGAHHTFGSISVSAAHDASPDLFSVYAATNPGGASLTLIVVNKDPVNAAQTTFALNGFTPSQVTSYTLSAASPNNIVPGSSQAWSSTMTFAPYSATMLVVTGSTANPPAVEWDLNPDTIMVPAGGTVTLAPRLLSPPSGASLTLGSATSDPGITATVSNSTMTATQNGSVQIAAGNTPGFYHFSVSSSNNTAQGGWIVVGKAAAGLAKASGDSQTGSVGSVLPQALTVTLTPGSSGGAAAGASIFFTTSAGSITNVLVGTEKVFTGSKVIAVTNSSGVASVTLTLPASAGPVTVKAEAPYGLGHPSAVFNETAQ
jgi:hypothetical protein